MSSHESTPDEPTKQCTKCKKVFPATTEYFYKQVRGTSELHSHCKPCANQARKAYYTLNKDKSQAYARQYAKVNKEARRAYSQEYSKKNKEKRQAYRATRRVQINQQTKQSRQRHLDKARARSREYNKTHKESVSAQLKAWKQANREHIREYEKAYRARRLEHFRAKGREYHKNHPEQARTQKKIRRARQLHAPINDFTQAQWVAMKAHYKHRCVYCGKKSQRLSQDHIQPLSKGGSHTYSNIVPSCRSCNSRKHTGPPLTPVQPLLIRLE